MERIERQRPEVESMSWTHLRLPPFPQVAIRVLQLANKENAQLHQMSDLIGWLKRRGRTRFMAIFPVQAV